MAIDPKAMAERLGAEVGIHRGFDRGAIRKPFDRPEPARIAEAEFGIVVEREHQMQVIRLGFVSRDDRELPGHPEVDAEKGGMPSPQSLPRFGSCACRAV